MINCLNIGIRRTTKGKRKTVTVHQMTFSKKKCKKRNDNHDMMYSKPTMSICVFIITMIIIMITATSCITFANASFINHSSTRTTTSCSFSSTHQRRQREQQQKEKNSSNDRRCIALSETKDDLIKLSKELNPIIGYWDPLGLADSAILGTNERTIGWLRHSEIKHGRIAMFAFLGYIAQYELRFPWSIALDGTPFPSIDLTPPEQWDYLPIGGKIQLLCFIGFLEYYSELTPGSGSDVGLPHYTTKEGRPGKYPPFGGKLPHPVPWDLYDPLKLFREIPESKRRRLLLVEINNGRLAMIGIMSFMCEHTISGSVPILKDVIKPYDGQIMAPFEYNIIIDYDKILSEWGL